MFGYRIKVDDELLEKLRKCAAKEGYASVDEFVLHILEKESSRLLGPGAENHDPEEEIKKRLQGLGYIE